jgi:hypothetical protein
MTTIWYLNILWSSFLSTRSYKATDEISFTFSDRRQKTVSWITAIIPQIWSALNLFVNVILICAVVLKYLNFAHVPVFKSSHSLILCWNYRTLNCLLDWSVGAHELPTRVVSILLAKGKEAGQLREGLLFRCHHSRVCWKALHSDKN